MSEHRALKTDETGSFELKDLDPAVAYRITVGTKGFADWTSAGIVLTPGQALEMTGIKLQPSNRGPGLVFSSTLINAGGRLANALVQEFVLHKYTTNANK